MAAAFMVITDGKRMLLVKRKEDGTLGLVGGGIEKGETPFQALMREFAEELEFPELVDWINIKKLIPLKHRSYKGIEPIYLYIYKMPSFELDLLHEYTKNVNNEEVAGTELINVCRLLKILEMGYGLTIPLHPALKRELFLIKEYFNCKSPI